MATTPQSRKAKGRRLQQYVRDLILRIGKGLTEGDAESRGMGGNGEDVMMSPKARQQFPVSIECKNIAAFAGYKYLDQAEVNAKGKYQPIAVVKANRKDPIVLVDAEYFFQLLAKANK